jgi:mono/diheme cytochrome c family protein
MNLNLQKELSSLLKSFTIFFCLFSTSYLSNAQNNGESLFKANCAACHTITSKKLVGPGLGDIHSKRDKEWLYKWIQNSQELIAAGDKEAIAIFEEYNKVVMPAQAVTNEEIDLMLDYIANPPASNTSAAGGSDEDTAKAAKETPVAVVIIAIVVLLFIIVLLNNVYKSLYQFAISKNNN